MKRKTHIAITFMLVICLSLVSLRYNFVSANSYEYSERLKTVDYSSDGMPLKFSIQTVDAENYEYISHFYNCSNQSMDSNSLQDAADGDDVLKQYCYDEKTIYSLQTIYNNETDNDKKIWLLNAIIFVAENTGSNNAGFEYSIMADSSYTNVKVTLRSGKTISFEKYIGSNPHSAYDDFNYPNTTHLYGPSLYYNCHSFAWIYGGDVSHFSENNLYWLLDPVQYYKNSGYFNSNCYTLIYSGAVAGSININSLDAGDIIVWLGNDEGLEDDEVLPGSRVHSGVVVNTNSGNRIKSKWGAGGVYLHDMNNHPYAYSTYTDDSGEVISVPRRISVLRPNASIDSSINPVVCQYRMKNENQHELLCAYCARNSVKTENHSFVTVGAMTKCSICGYIRGISQNKINVAQYYTVSMN